MRTGPKGVPPGLKVVAGTDQPCRRRAPVVPSIDGAPVKPKWLKGRAARLWAEKCEVYRQRGQAVAGCESALAQYCALEAALVEQYRKGLTPPTAQVNAYRVFAAEFFDTPASQFAPAKGNKGGRFASNIPTPGTGDA